MGGAGYSYPDMLVEVVDEVKGTRFNHTEKGCVSWRPACVSLILEFTHCVAVIQFGDTPPHPQEGEQEEREGVKRHGFVGWPSAPSRVQLPVLLTWCLVPCALLPCTLRCVQSVLLCTIHDARAACGSAAVRVGLSPSAQQPGHRLRLHRFGGLGGSGGWALPSKLWGWGVRAGARC
jgi:hypothetical protein